jgi:DNA processing protein
MHWYPASNYGLFKKILEKGGALLSPFCMDTQPSKNTFPSRNNVIAGISDAIVVIQAAKKSGTFITAQAGLEFGRNIGIIPGPIHDLLSQGGYELIRQGASLVTNKNDIYELLSLNNDMKKNENINIEQKIIIVIFYCKNMIIVFMYEWNKKLAILVNFCNVGRTNSFNGRISQITV